MAYRATIGDAPPMAWFLRAIEQPDGDWACSHGRTVYDEHDTLPEALDHLHVIGATMQPVELYAHWRDGAVERVGPA